MPFVGVRLNLRLDEAAHLAAHGFERLVHAAFAEMAGAFGLADQFDEPRARRRRIRPDERHHARTREGVGVPGCHIEVAKPHHLRLAHRDAAQNLRRIFANAGLREQRFHLAEAASLGQALRIGRHLLDGLGVGGKPSEAVAGVLFALDRLRVERAIPRDPGADRRRSPPQKLLRIAGSLLAKLTQIRRHNSAGVVARSSVKAHRVSFLANERSTQPLILSFSLRENGRPNRPRSVQHRPSPIGRGTG